ncbi:helix-turn-helix domain-containing protein [Paenibacillus mesophilus]|uniref:AraC family transcriptional regulator n=1 Tax=Paenibacillus mesophilus TaxID=2582849 RepID=UPI00110EAA0B|nr:AraC family transcriptional regulator [Paenibacillus mesophilus]TMV46165.1 helix-turn-helix domain-containing protein [Paenibacillus mesophilus]
MTDTGDAVLHSAKRVEKRNPYAFINGRHKEWERRDIRFRWGNYGFRILHFHWTTFSPSRVVGFHKHAEYEFHFIPRGKGVVIMDDIAHPFHEGMFYLTGPDVEHRQEADDREGMDELCLHIDIVKLDTASSLAHEDGMEASSGWGADSEADEAEECVRRLQELPRRPTADQFGAMDRFMTAFLAWTENEPGMYTTIKQSVIQILLRSVRAFGHHQAESSIPTRDMNAYRIQMASQFIEANYMRQITLEDVAEKIHISGRQLQRIFRENGMGSFSDYVEEVRLQAVCRSLAGTDEPIERIALAQGFSSSNYLYFVFRKRFGMTPGAYRKNTRSEAKQAK